MKRELTEKDWQKWQSWGKPSTLYLPFTWVALVILTLVFASLLRDVIWFSYIFQIGAGFAIVMFIYSMAMFFIGRHHIKHQQNSVESNTP